MPATSRLRRCITWFVLLPVACAEPPAATFAVRDSASITIVENSAPAWKPGQEWRVDSLPSVSIGGANADSAYTLHEAIHARILRNGNIAVVNSSTGEVRIFDSRGRHVRSIGRKGQGPGEFQGVWWVGEQPGDTLHALDIGPGFLLSRFDSDGRFIDRNPAAVSQGVEDVELQGQFADGSLLVHRFQRGGAPAGAEPRRIYVQLFRISPTGARLDSMGRFPNQTIATGSYFWGPWGHAAPAESTFYFGAGDSFEIEERALDGRLLRLIRLNRAPRATTQADIDTFNAVRMRRFRKEGRQEPGSAVPEELLRRYVTSARYAPTLPAYFHLRTDPEGNLWVQEYATERIGSGRVWSVFDRRGVYLGDITLPGSFRLLQLGRDGVLGIWSDADEVEHVRIYPLKKPGKGVAGSG